MIEPGDIDRAASVFASRWVQGYVRGKMKSDPIYRIVAERVAASTLPLLDVGCGLGLMSIYLHLRSDARRVVGIDHDDRKLVAARAAAAALGTSGEFGTADARALPPFSGDVALLDLLHYFSPQEQAAILRSAACCTAPGGLLLIRDCLDDGSWRYWVTAGQERFSKAIGWLRGERLVFPTRQSIAETLATEGLRLVDVRPLWFRTPFNNHLLVFSRS